MTVLGRWADVGVWIVFSIRVKFDKYLSLFFCGAHIRVMLRLGKPTASKDAHGDDENAIGGVTASPRAVQRTERALSPITVTTTFPLARPFSR